MMQQIIAYAISIWLLAVMFITSATANNIGFIKRNEDRNINLLGKEAVNHMYVDETGSIRFDESKCIKSICRMPGSDNVAGMIFVYETYITGVNRTGEVIDRVDIGHVSDRDKISLINRMVNKIYKGREKAAMIEIAGKDVTDAFFNSIDEGVTLFLLSDNGTSLAVSGYTVS